MRKVIVTLLYCYIAALLAIGVAMRSYRASHSWAQTPEATKSSPALNRIGEGDSGLGSKIDKINLLKEKVASKVAQLSKSIQFAADGTIIKIEEDILTFSADGDEKTVTTDDQTRYLLRNNRLKTKTGDISDFEVNDDVTVLGSEQIGTDLVSAKLIVKAPRVVFFTGIIKEVDAANGTLTIKEKESEYVFDYEVYTRSQLYNKKIKKLNSSGFSKLEKGQQVQILALPQKDSESRFTALRLVIIPK